MKTSLRNSLYGIGLAVIANVAMGQQYGRGFKKPEGADYGVAFLKLKRTADLPEAYDLRDLKLVSPIRQQGGCGSCWAFSTLDALESNALVQGQPQHFLSTQELVNCNFSGCGGGYFAYPHVQRYGVTTAANLPYRGRDGRCQRQFPDKHYVSNWFRLGTTRARPTVDEIKTAMHKYGAVSVTTAAARWNGYRGGVKRGCGNYRTDHMVTLVGWKTDKTWVLKNSWGTGWGDKGYGYFPYGCDNTGEEAAVGIYKSAVVDVATAATLPKEIPVVKGKIKVALPVVKTAGKIRFTDEGGEDLAVNKDLDIEALDISEVHLEVETEEGVLTSKAQVVSK